MGGGQAYLFVNEMLQGVTVNDEDFVQTIQDGILRGKVAETSVGEIIFSKGLVQVPLLEVERRA